MIGYISPVVDQDVNQTAQVIFTVVMVVLTIATLVFCISAAVRKDWLPFAFVLAGGLLTSFNESFWSNANHLWYHTGGQWTLYIAFGIHIPVWMPAAYVWSYGAMGYVTYRLVAQGATRRTIVKLAIGICLIVAPMDVFLIQLHVYEYSGDVPMTVLGAPVWQYAMRWGVLMVISGIVVANLRSKSTLPVAAYALVIPVVFVTVDYAAALLYLVALNADGASSALISLSAFSWIGFTGVALWIACRDLPREGDKPEASLLVKRQEEIA